GVYSEAAVPWDLPVIVFGQAALLAALVGAVIKNYLFRQHFGAAFARWLAILMPVAYVVELRFPQDFSHQSPFTEGRQLWPVYMAQFLILQAVFLFAAVATACSTRLGQVPTLVICVVVFLIGLSSDFYLGRLAAGENSTWWGNMLYAAVPNLGFHLLADA